MASKKEGSINGLLAEAEGAMAELRRSSSSDWNSHVKFNNAAQRLLSAANKMTAIDSPKDDNGNSIPHGRSFDSRCGVCTHRR